mmetsp:Transcript_42053/g.121972  ORF Transcript_42053/g.121972 Transcript_42053/m.121972 type:complete len:223 (-) Transcript_42053:17-685(-)
MQRRFRLARLCRAGVLEVGREERQPGPRHVGPRDDPLPVGARALPAATGLHRAHLQEHARRAELRLQHRAGPGLAGPAYRGPGARRPRAAPARQQPKDPHHSARRAAGLAGLRKGSWNPARFPAEDLALRCEPPHAPPRAARAAAFSGAWAATAGCGHPARRRTAQADHLLAAHRQQFLSIARRAFVRGRPSSHRSVASRVLRCAPQARPNVGRPPGKWRRF